MVAEQGHSIKLFIFTVMNTTLTSEVYHYDTWVTTEFKSSLNVVCVHMQERHSSETKGLINLVW